MLGRQPILDRERTAGGLGSDQPAELVGRREVAHDPAPAVGVDEQRPRGARRSGRVMTRAKLLARASYLELGGRGGGRRTPPSHHLSVATDSCAFTLGR